MPPLVLLTGASGFVGRHVHRTLLERGFAVRTVGRSESAERLIERRDAVFVDDIFLPAIDWWAQTCASIDTIVHAAWYVEPKTYLGAPENIACLQGSIALARGALKAGVGHFIGIGTCFEYRHGPDPLGIDTPIEPQSLYAASKAALFLVLQALCSNKAMGLSWARLFYLFGDGEAPSRFVPYLRDRLARGIPADLSAGTQQRDFLDVRDAAAMIVDVVATGQLGAINICSGQSITIRRLAEQIADEYGRRDLLRFGAVPFGPTDPPAIVGHCNLTSF